ncbi:MAG: hypothetical protein ABIH37_05930 [archaeon]
MEYKVYTTNEFDKEIEKLSGEEKRRIEIIFLQLKENPYVGNQLQIRPLREKRFEEKRIYYLIFDDLKSILMIAISDKRNQQKMIDFIRENINNYRDILKEILDN